MNFEKGGRRVAEDDSDAQEDFFSSPAGGVKSLNHQKQAPANYQQQQNSRAPQVSSLMDNDDS